MKERERMSLEGIAAFLAGSGEVEFKAAGPDGPVQMDGE
jgi:hypothetical protein